MTSAATHGFRQTLDSFRAALRSAAPMRWNQTDEGEREPKASRSPRRARSRPIQKELKESEPQLAQPRPSYGAVQPQPEPEPISVRAICCKRCGTLSSIALHWRSTLADLSPAQRGYIMRNGSLRSWQGMVW
jgi:hypothetical protein